MKAQDLKNSILQMAMEGKLVPQDPNDEPASVLLERIKEEKERLIKEKKIKRNNEESVIFRKNNQFWEKVCEGEEICIDDEIPFDIPNSWQWCRMENIIQLISGRDMKSNEYNDNEIGVPYITGASNIENSKLIINRWIENPGVIALENDILLTCKGTIGKLVILNEEKVHIARQIMALRIIDEDLLFRKYILLVLEYYVNKLQNMAKSMIPGISREDILKILVPLPPINEQKRIVEKIEELLPLIEYYDKLEKELNKLNDEFPSKIKDSILHEAIQGKLVPQDYDDEPASVLLEKIRAEKERLLEGKIIKKNKNESFIFKENNHFFEKIRNEELVCIDDELPFNIPSSWNWVRLNSLGEIVGGGTPKTTVDEYWNDGDIPWLTPADMKFVEGKYVRFGKRNITNVGLEKSSAKLIPKNSIIYSSRAPIGYIAIAKNELCTNQGFKSLVPYDKEIVDYVYYCLIALTKDIQSRASGTTFKEISGTKFGETLIPLPPLNEQKRIISRIEKLITELNI